MAMGGGQEHAPAGSLEPGGAGWGRRVLSVLQTRHAARRHRLAAAVAGCDPTLGLPPPSVGRETSWLMAGTATKVQRLRHTAHVAQPKQV